MSLQSIIDRWSARFEWAAAGASGAKPRPFILLSSKRSGNNMLRSALDRHPDLYFETEVFLFAHKSEEHRLVPPDLIPLIRNNPVKACVKIFRARSPVKAAGFTLFHDQMLEADQVQLWKFLSGFSGLHVIDLRRRNLFLQWLSLCEALAYDQWVLYPTDQPVWDKPLELSPRDFLQWLDEYERLCSDALACLAAHPRLELFYEDLQRNFQGESEKVQNFLGVPVREEKPMTRKMSVRTVADRIANWSSFARALGNTRGESFVKMALEEEAGA